MLRAQAHQRCGQPVVYSVEHKTPTIRFWATAALALGAVLLSGWNAAQAQWPITRVKKTGNW